MFAVPDDTIWPLEPHTKAKHSILRRYLQAYFPKMASAQRRIVFVDGFAGPGEYEEGEPGSPIVALDALVEHRHLPRMSNSEFVFLFIEERQDRFDNLEAILAQRANPSNVSVATRCGTFEEHLGKVLGDLGERRMAPAFVMVDPFGPRGLPLKLLRRLADHPKTELLVSLMYEPISRFLEHPTFESHLDDLFGTREWRDAAGLEADAKKTFLSQLYARQLRGIGMDYVRLFEMRDAGNRPEYFLAFATQNKEGLRVIKEAMWKVDQAGGIAFSDFTAPSPGQGTLFAAEPDDGELRQLLMGQFDGQLAVPIEEVNDFVLVDTPFRETHGRKVLGLAAKNGAIDVTRPYGKTKAYWNVGTTVTFRPPE